MTVDEELDRVLTLPIEEWPEAPPIPTSDEMREALRRREDHARRVRPNGRAQGSHSGLRFR